MGLCDGVSTNGGTLPECCKNQRESNQTGPGVGSFLNRRNPPSRPQGSKDEPQTKIGDPKSPSPEGCIAHTPRISTANTAPAWAIRGGPEQEPRKKDRRDNNGGTGDNPRGTSDAPKGSLKESPANHRQQDPTQSGTRGMSPRSIVMHSCENSGSWLANDAPERDPSGSTKDRELHFAIPGPTGPRKVPRRRIRPPHLDQLVIHASAESRRTPGAGGSTFGEGPPMQGTISGVVPASVSGVYIQGNSGRSSISSTTPTRGPHESQAHLR